MIYGIVFDRNEEAGFPQGYYYAHIPALGLTTQGEGIEGARRAMSELARLWIEEKLANGETVPEPSESFFSTLEIPNHALQSA